MFGESSSSICMRVTLNLPYHTNVYIYVFDDSFYLYIVSLSLRGKGVNHTSSGEQTFLFLLLLLCATIQQSLNKKIHHW